MLTRSLSVPCSSSKFDAPAWWDAIFYPSTDNGNDTSAAQPAPAPQPDGGEEVPFYSQLLDSIIYVRSGKRTK